MDVLEKIEQAELNKAKGTKYFKVRCLFKFLVLVVGCCAMISVNDNLNCVKTFFKLCPGFSFFEIVMSFLAEK